jgi:hypothetical protein
MSETSQKEQLRDTGGGGEKYHRDALTVNTDNRIALTKGLCEDAGVGHNDVVDIQVDTGEMVFWILDAVVDTQHRVRIPKRKRELYDVEEGDSVDIIMQPTGMVMER